MAEPLSRPHQQLMFVTEKRVCIATGVFQIAGMSNEFVNQLAIGHSRPRRLLLRLENSRDGILVSSTGKFPVRISMIGN
ncbi:hypothetical protein [Taklimakanibacter lacteus]|uniref:hypothetical protein n=1 Tax=Taklimakanibacter lacteus TaxID=2268456 RepID=UPI000E67011B